MESAEPIPTIGTQGVVIEYPVAAGPCLHVLRSEEKHFRVTPGYLRTLENTTAAGPASRAQVGIHAVTVVRNNRVGLDMAGMPLALGLGDNFERWAEIDFLFR